MAESKAASHYLLIKRSANIKNILMMEEKRKGRERMIVQHYQKVSDELKKSLALKAPF